MRTIATKHIIWLILYDSFGQKWTKKDTPFVRIPADLLKKREIAIRIIATFAICEIVVLSLTSLWRYNFKKRKGQQYESPRS